MDRRNLSEKLSSLVKCKNCTKNVEKIGKINNQLNCKIIFLYKECKPLSFI